MFSELAMGFLGGIVAHFLASFLTPYLKTGEKGKTLGGMAIPGRRVQKRTPKALTDLMAYQKEIQEQGESRG